MNKNYLKKTQERVKCHSQRYMFWRISPLPREKIWKKVKYINMQNSQFWNVCINFFILFSPIRLKMIFEEGRGDDFSWFYIPLSTQATHLKNVLNIFVMDPSVPGGERTPGELDIEVMEELEGEVRDSEGDSMELSDDNLYDSWWLLVYKITLFLSYYRYQSLKWLCY